MGFRMGESRKSEEGFTIVELLISILVSAIVLAAVSAAFIVQNKSFSNQEQVVDAQEHARAALQLMTKELLMAGYDPTAGADAGILVADSHTIRFTMDIVGDGDVADANEDITYALDATENQVTRKVGSSGTPQPIAENIEALTFTYFDSDDNALTPLPLDDPSDRARITRVSVEVTPKMPETAGFNHNAGEEGVVQLAKVGAVQAWTFVRDALVPDAHAKDKRGLKSSVTPHGLRRTRAGAGGEHHSAKDESHVDDTSS
jgi:type II secretory pathway pseudopilin PulG